MSSNLIGPAAIVVLIVGAAFVIGRVRAGGLDPRRDGVVLVAIAVMGVVAALIVVAAPNAALILLPIGLVVGGTYLMTSPDGVGGIPEQRDRIRVIGVGAVILGVFGILTAVLRPGG